MGIIAFTYSLVSVKWVPYVLLINKRLRRLKWIFWQAGIRFVKAYLEATLKSLEDCTVKMAIPVKKSAGCHTDLRPFSVSIIIISMCVSIRILTLKLFCESYGIYSFLIFWDRN